MKDDMLKRLFAKRKKEPTEEEVQEESEYQADKIEAFRIAERAKLLAAQLSRKAAELQKELANGHG